jgi:hypothetical protein
MSWRRVLVGASPPVTEKIGAMGREIESQQLLKKLIPAIETFSKKSKKHFRSIKYALDQFVCSVNAFLHRLIALSSTYISVPEIIYDFTFCRVDSS